MSAFYAPQVGIQCLLKDTTAGQISGEFRESTIFILGLLLISINVHQLYMQKNHLVSQSSSYTFFIFWFKTSGCHMTLSGALQSDTVALTRHESEQPSSLKLCSTNGSASSYCVSMQSTDSGSQLPQEELLKSDEDEGHLPVRPVQLGSQRKP